jgi:2,3-bisphosphoglycerate-independent phosphoglycerate mutase
MTATGTNPPRNVPCVLIVRDGWGINPHGAERAADATRLARTPMNDMLERDWPHVMIRTSGEDVGLPVEDGQPVMGNSEVGHQNIGAGRIVDQELMRITRAIRSGDFARNPALLAACARAKETGEGGRPRALHVMGLVGSGKVHSDFAHLEALLRLAKAQGVPADRIFVHAFTDGRDTPQTSGLPVVERLEAVLRETGGRIATIGGRYWAMDRDFRWDRVQRAWDAILGRADVARGSGAVQVLRDYYAKPSSPNMTGDEFVPPTRLLQGAGVPNDGDAVVFFNFRGDRPRELTMAFVLPDADWKAVKGGGFARDPRPRDVLFTAMTRYEEGLPMEVAFDRPGQMPDIMGAWIAQLGLTQFRCAETEKFPHVTFFFNDYREEPFPGERRQLVPSPKDVQTYDQKPEMSAHGVRDAVLARLAAPDCEPFIVVNFANPDMVGHTGNLDAVVKACETVDACVGAIVDATLARGGSLVITADHGNAEQMKDPVTGAPQTAHTNFDVELFVVGAAFRGARLREGGRLADIAPTMLAMMGLPQPPAMTGTSLLPR